MLNGKGLTIKGELSAAEDLTIDFSFEGVIDAAGHRVTIPEGSQVQATVTAGIVIVQGALDGHIAADRVELAATAAVNGSVVADKLLMMNGAIFNGPINTERARAAGEVAKHRRQGG
jgi:cytoskeletal protein CcmA (bactofilin family)